MIVTRSSFNSNEGDSGVFEVRVQLWFWVNFGWLSFFSGGVMGSPMYG